MHNQNDVEGEIYLIRDTFYQVFDQLPLRSVGDKIVHFIWMSIHKTSWLVVDGGGVKKGMDGNVVGMLMFGIEGIVVGIVGNDAGRGGSTSLGIVVGIVGSVGIVGRVGRGVVGNGGIAAFGSVGIVGNGGIETLGKDGIVGSVGTEVCSKWRAKLTSITASDRAATKERMKRCLAVAIFYKSKGSEGELSPGFVKFEMEK
ncbi:hypothetical protein AgCh_021434 [Apium graveolens]